MANTIKVLPVFQNQQDFFVGIFTISQLLKFTKYTKRLIVSYDENNEPVYNKQIQREVEPSRVNKIADFLINDPEATFPTNLVLHIPVQVIESQKKNGDFVEIEINEKVFSEVEKEKKSESTGDIFISIIDGQHRVSGIEAAIEQIETRISDLNKTLQKSPNNKDLTDKLNYYSTRQRDLLNIQMVVTFFVDKTLEYQAMIFSTINRTQKRVSESLVYSLFGLTTEDSPQKSALQIALGLNALEESPFYERVKLYGEEYDKNQSPPLSQATMVKSIIDLISENSKEAENDRFRKRSELSKRSDGSSKKLPFRRYYANNKDESIYDLFYYFFNAVKDTFVDDAGKSYWMFTSEIIKPNNILQTTVGYQALLALLVDLLDVVKDDTARFKKETYAEYLKKCKTLRFYDTGRYPYTSVSKTILHMDMSLAIWPAQSNDDARITKLNDALKKIPAI